MNYVEITMSDGTVARWAIESDDKTDAVAVAIEEIVGKPDTIIT